jgi:hypothetical protein
MLIDVKEKCHDDPDADKHDIDLQWNYGEDGRPTLLQLTMFCPYGEK